MAKNIDLRRINEHCVNKLMMKTIQDAGLAAKDDEITLVKIALKHRRSKKSSPEAYETRKQITRKKTRNLPFYAFYKPVGKTKAAIFRIKTGELMIVSLASISKTDEVKGTFSIDGITYGPKDTINGFRRFGQYK